jgi:hypothetical protein
MSNVTVAAAGTRGCRADRRVVRAAVSGDIEAIFVPGDDGDAFRTGCRDADAVRRVDDRDGMKARSGRVAD